MNYLKEANTLILNQLKFVLTQFDRDDYQKQLQILTGASIGQHARHIIEFYQCFFDGQIARKINYDARNRDLRIESDLKYALNLIEILLSKIEVNQFSESINLEVSFGNNHVIAVGTTAARELTYLIEHTIHHLAILNIAIKTVFKEVVLPENFGIAFSTIHYQNNRNITA